jgi:hypothetical protein
MKKIILLAMIAGAGMFGASQTALASSATLNISPASQERTVGETFNISVKLNPVGNKVCVVKGTLDLDNLSCRQITVASGLLAQKSPSCARPSFTIGIPGCATSSKDIFSVSVRGKGAGQEIVSISSSKVIGEGVDVPASTRSGVYDIVAASTTTSADTSAAATTSAAPAEETAAPDEETSSETAPETAPATTGVKLFDIALTIENALLDKASDLVSRTQFTSFGNVPTPVVMTYRVEDANGKTVHAEKDEVTVETEKLVTKYFASLSLAKGKYTLFLETTYGDNVRDEFRQAFEVRKAVSDSGRKTWIWIVSGLIIAAVAGFIIFIFIKRKKEEQ